MSTIVIPANGPDNADMHALGTSARSDMLAAETLAASGVGIYQRTVTIDILGDDFAGLIDDASDFSKDMGLPLPSDARIIACVVGEADFVPFQRVVDFDFIQTTAQIFIGGEQMGISVNVKDGTDLPKLGYSGGAMMPVGGAQLSAKIQSNISLNSFVAGTVTVTVYAISML